MEGATGRQRVPLKVMQNISIPLPPLAEQTRIVEKLDAVLFRIDTAIDELQQSLALVDAMFKSRLDKAFNPVGSPSNEDGLYELPEGWGWKQLHTIADVVSGYAFKSEDFSSDIGVPSVKITNVGLGTFIESQDDYLPSDFSTKYNKFAVKQGDIVIALTRPVINGGLKVCRVPKNYNGALVNQRVAAVVYNHEAILEYVYWFLLSPMTLEYVVEKSKSLNQPNLSIKDLSKLEVPLPNISEQQKVVEALDALNEQTTQLKTELTAKIGMFNQLKASVLDGAFRGEL
jgi:type I restriction enzyme S subunit